MKTSHSFDERYQFQGKAKTWSLVMIAIGVIGILFGFLSGSGQRTFSNLLLMGYYMSCVSICGIFFCAVQYVAVAGWPASLLRIPQAFGRILPAVGLILLVIVCGGLFITHPGANVDGKSTIVPYLYREWALKGITTVGDPNYNANIAGKAGLLNVPFFLVRLVVYLAAYSGLGWMMMKYSENEDELGGMFNYNKAFKVSIIFLVVFGFTIPLFAFDTIMSLEAHWFSTMFGWYNFAGLWVSGLSVIALTLIYLRKAGYIQWVTEDHLHNFGQLIFGFSIFWTYTWFAQFLLTWYANLPEEAAYFYKRWQPEFKPWFWLNLIINFVSPLLVLMSRDSKRLVNVLKVECIILIIGHWLDYWQMIMPGTVGPQSKWYLEIGPIEITVFIGFAGVFIYLMLNALSKFKSLAPKKHPLLEESLYHHI